MPLATIGTIASVGLNAYGAMKGDKTKTSPKSGFFAYPKEVQDALLKTAFPDIMTNYSKPRLQTPMLNANFAGLNPEGEGKGILAYQKFMDAKQADTPEVAPTEQTPGMKPGQYEELLGRIAANQAQTSLATGRGMHRGGIPVGSLKSAGDYQLYGKMQTDGRPLVDGAEIMKILSGVDKKTLSPAVSELISAWGA